MGTGNTVPFLRKKGDKLMKFTINGKEYEGAKYNFNTSCQFEEMGVNIADIGKKPFGVLRAYLAISGKMDLEKAGDEIEKHIVSGGDLDEMQAVLSKELTDSGFIKSLQARATEETEEIEKKPKK